MIPLMPSILPFVTPSLFARPSYTNTYGNFAENKQAFNKMLIFRKPRIIQICLSVRNTHWNFLYNSCIDNFLSLSRIYLSLLHGLYGKIFLPLFCLSIFLSPSISVSLNFCWFFWSVFSQATSKKSKIGLRRH